MVFYSTKSNENVFHLPHCIILRRIQHENKQHFATPEEARAAGYRMCSCCSPVGAKLRREKSVVDQFCLEHDFTCTLYDGQLHIVAPKSQWRIIVNGKSNNLFLYHKNTYEKAEKIPSIIPGFHSQAVRSKTVLGYLEYIVQHDDFRKKHAEKAKMKAASMSNLRKNTRKFSRGKDNCHFSSNQLYSILDKIYL